MLRSHFSDLDCKGSALAERYCDTVPALKAWSVWNTCGTYHYINFRYNRYLCICIYTCTEKLVFTLNGPGFIQSHPTHKTAFNFNYLVLKYKSGKWWCGRYVRKLFSLVFTTWICQTIYCQSDVHCDVHVRWYLVPQEQGRMSVHWISICKWIDMCKTNYGIGLF